MKEAISMYLGGFVIKADDCNYDSAKQWGLKCPFCDSAVFLRSQSVRKIGGNDKLFGAYFSHYPCGNGDDLLCEKRSFSKQGKKQIEQIEVQRRNQRLKIYNIYLWQIIVDDLGWSNKYFSKVRNVFGGDKWLEAKAIEVRKSLLANSKKAHQFLDATLEDCYPLNHFQFLKTEFDFHVHKAIVNEIFSFLCTDTAGYVFVKAFKAAMLSSYLIQPYSKDLFMKKDAPPTFFWLSVCFLVSSVNWQKQIAKHLPVARTPVGFEQVG